MTDVAAARRHLLDIPDLYALLPLFVLPGSGASDERRGSGSPKKAPAKLDVFDLRDARAAADMQPWRSRDDYVADKLEGSRRQGVIPTLASWSRLVDSELWDEGLEHDELGLLACSAVCDEAPVRARKVQTLGPCSAVTLQHCETPTIAGECGFLLAHLEWAAEHQWFHELADDVARIRRDLREAVGERDPIALICTIETCRWPVEVMDAGSWFRCTGCGRTWSRVEAHRLYERQKPMTLAECAEALGRPVKTLHHWQAKRWIHSVGRDGRGRLYRLADVQAAALGIVNGQKVEA